MELTDQGSEFDARPIAPKPLLEGPLAPLLEWRAMAEGAYSANTLRAQKADGAIFQAFCESRRESYLPADPITIRAFMTRVRNAMCRPRRRTRRRSASNELAGSHWTNQFVTPSRVAHTWLMRHNTCTERNAPGDEREHFRGVRA
jgi:hypothetical protein